MARSSLKSVLRLIDSAKNEVPVEQNFLMELQKTIELVNDANRRLPSQTYKPSSMNCIRNMYYQVTGHPQVEGSSEYSMVGICNSGTDIHERVQNAVNEMQVHGFDCEYINVAQFVKDRGLDYLEIRGQNACGTETKLFHKDLNMSFMCDGIIRYKSIYYILELKTEAEFKWLPRKGVDPKHYAQGTAYSIAFGIPEVIFVYINRNMLNMKSFMFRPTDEMKNELLSKISTCDSYVKEHALPPKPENASNKLCGYCNYYNDCNLDKN